MSYRVVIHPDLAPTFRKVRAKDPARYEQLKKKIRLLVENPESGKPLHPPLKGLNGSDFNPVTFFPHAAIVNGNVWFSF